MRKLISHSKTRQFPHNETCERASNVEPAPHAKTSTRVRRVRLSDLRRENQSAVLRQRVLITRVTKLVAISFRPLS
jgi:hypothetical protein